MYHISHAQVTSFLYSWIDILDMNQPFNWRAEIIWEPFQNETRSYEGFNLDHWVSRMLCWFRAIRDSRARAWKKHPTMKAAPLLAMPLYTHLVPRSANRSPLHYAILCEPWCRLINFFIHREGLTSRCKISSLSSLETFLKNIRQSDWTLLHS